LRDLTRELGVGTCCGKCLPFAKTALAESLSQRNECAPAYFPVPATEFAA
jgi:bacterioferritin-associated ferredoxin